MVVMLMLLFHRLEKLCPEIDGVLQNLKELFTGERRQRRCDDGCLLVDFANQGDGLINLLLIGNVRARKHNGLCILHLVVEELAKVLHIELRLLHIDQCDRGVARNEKLFLDVRNRAQYVRELTHTGGLDDNAVRRVLTENLLQRGREITDQGAANAAGIHLPHLNARILQKAAVNADFTEFVLNEHYLFAGQCLREQFFNKSGLSRTEKTGNDIYLSLCHDEPPFLFYLS